MKCLPLSRRSSQKPLIRERSQSVHHGVVWVRGLEKTSSRSAAWRFRTSESLNLLQGVLRAQDRRTPKGSSEHLQLIQQRWWESPTASSPNTSEYKSELHSEVQDTTSAVWEQWFWWIFVPWSITASCMVLREVCSCITNSENTEPETGLLHSHPPNLKLLLVSCNRFIYNMSPVTDVVKSSQVLRVRLVTQ